jgi:membrane protein DedA with SNARE-associated domain
MNFIKQNIYYFLFVILIFEWPVTAFVGGDYAAQWELNLVLFCIIALAGDVVGDVVLYFLWRYFHKSKRVNKFNTLKKAKDYIVEQKFLEKLLSKYAFLYFLVVKITPYVSGTWLTIAWIKKYNFWKFLLYCTIISCIVKAVYIWLGYLWGISLAKLQVIQNWRCNFTLFLILWIILFYIVRFFSRKFMVRLKENLKMKNK